MKRNGRPTADWRFGIFCACCPVSRPRYAQDSETGTPRQGVEQHRMDKLSGVTIIIPNFNYAHFVSAAIESALAQDHLDCEVIVVDDCSTDGSQAIIEGYGDRVRAIFRPTN